MRKNTIYIVVIAFLTLVAVVLFWQQKSGTISKELRDFAVEDTASITKIFMVSKENEKVLLEKKDNIWWVNEKYRARPDAIKMLLRTIKLVDVKAPVAKSMFKTIVSNLAVKSIKIEIYKGENRIKTYYVGGPSKDQYGTYMLLENSSQPFITHIKGFKGYLTPRYFTGENLWRDRLIVSYRPDQISKVSVKQPRNEDMDFVLINENDNIKLISPSGKNILQYDTVHVMQFLSSFKKIAFDSYVDKMKQQKRDSISKSQPHYIISIEDVNGLNTEIKTFYHPNEGIIGSDGNLLKYDPDYEYALINENVNDMVLIQYYVFNAIFKGIDYFNPRFEN